MSIETNIESAWTSSIWSHATIKAYTTNAFKYEITDASEHEISQLYFENRINFIEWVVERSVKEPLIGSNRGLLNFTVSVRYTLEKDTAGESFRQVRDLFSDLSSLVRSQLTENWGGTVDFYTEQSSPVAIATVALDDLPCWQAVYIFSGTLETSL